MAKSLQGQVVLITGASSGFGEQAALLFSREGCKVILAARRIERLKELAERIKAEGGEALAIHLDVNQRAEIDRMVQIVLDVYGQIDILFNNAGFGRLDWLENLDPYQDIEAQVDVNLLGVLQVTRAVLPHMISRRSGHIINMSSVAGWVAAPLYSIYAATKFGVRGFTESLRREVRHLGIRVSGIYPGGAATEFGDHTGDNPGGKLRDNPLKRAIKTPIWLNMSAEYVAKGVVRIAKHPRRTLIIPWWMSLPVFFNSHLPGLADWVQVQVAKRYH